MPVVNQETFRPDTFVVDTICDWLSGRPSYTPEIASKDTQALLDDILNKSGLSAPYTPEQRTINAMLLVKKADAFTCEVAWQFYNDYHGIDSGQATTLAA